MTASASVPSVSADCYHPSHAANRRLVTASYVIAESCTLLQARVGLAAVRSLHEDLCPLLDVTWVDATLHDAAVAALLIAGRRRLSLVDWVGFTLMRQRQVIEAFAFDDDFADQGFTVLP